MGDELVLAAARVLHEVGRAHDGVDLGLDEDGSAGEVAGHLLEVFPATRGCSPDAEVDEHLRS